jgi:hypothetical protein
MIRRTALILASARQARRICLSTATDGDAEAEYVFHIRSRLLTPINADFDKGVC